jgi:hypothetical protein
MSANIILGVFVFLFFGSFYLVGRIMFDRLKKEENGTSSWKKQLKYAFYGAGILVPSWLAIGYLILLFAKG